MNNFEIVKSLCEACGVAGEEQGACFVATEMLKDICDEVSTDSMNSVIAVFKRAEEGQKTVMLDAHIDEIGLIVVGFTSEGFLKVAKCGGVDIRGLIGRDVKILAKEKPLTGVVCSIPPHLSSGDNANKIPEVGEIAIDIGFSKEDAQKLVSLGDRIIIPIETRQLLGNLITSKALDDRAGCASIVMAAQKLDKNKLNCGVVINFSAQEEVGANGSRTSSYKIDPDMAIAVDVSFAQTPDSPAFKCGEMSKGPMIGVAPILDTKMSNDLAAIAKEKNIPYQMEIMGGTTGTNCDEISVSRCGVKTALLSIPQKYMHSSIEVCDLDDIENIANLIAEYLYTL